MTDIKDVLEYAEKGDILTEDVVTVLTGGALAGISAENLSGLNAIQLANLLKEKGILTGDTKQRMFLAKRLLEIFKEYDIKPASVSTEAGRFPDTIKVVTDKTIEQMNASELLEYLKKNTQDIEALELIRTKEPVRTAITKTKEWVVAKDGAIDAAATLDYCRFLMKQGTAPMSRFKESKTVSIEQALGIKEKPLVHPLFEGELIQNGLDKWENDWSTVDRNWMKAILWARRTGHKMWPKYIDPTDTFEEVTSQELSKRWRTIKEDYFYAVTDEDPSATEISLVYQARAVKGRAGEEVQPEKKIVRPTEADLNELKTGVKELANLFGGEEKGGGGDSTSREMSAKEYVKSHAKGNLEKSGMGNSVTGVFENIEVNGMNNTFNAAVIVSAEISGMRNEGVIYSPPGVNVEISGANNSLVHEQRSWEEIAQMIKKHKI